MSKELWGSACQVPPYDEKEGSQIPLLTILMVLQALCESCWNVAGHQMLVSTAELPVDAHPSIAMMASSAGLDPVASCVLQCTQCVVSALQLPLARDLFRRIAGITLQFLQGWPANMCSWYAAPLPGCAPLTGGSPPQEQEEGGVRRRLCAPCCPAVVRQQRRAPAHELRGQLPAAALQQVSEGARE